MNRYFPGKRRVLQGYPGRARCFRVTLGGTTVSRVTLEEPGVSGLPWKSQVFQGYPGRYHRFPGLLSSVVRDMSSLQSSSRSSTLNLGDFLTLSNPFETHSLSVCTRRSRYQPASHHVASVGNVFCKTTLNFRKNRQKTVHRLQRSLFNQIIRKYAN